MTSQQIQDSFDLSSGLGRNALGELVYSAEGWCNICESDTVFSSEHTWFRDFLKCKICQSIPRERALLQVLNQVAPQWRDASIHEGAPGAHGTSLKLRDECPNYSSSHFFPDFPLGEIHPHTGHRCENLESMTFDDESFDIFITQDVMEHVFRPDLVFREVTRVLKPEGSFVLTVPMVKKSSPSERRSTMTDEGIIHHKPAEYHGNPIDNKGSLVTIDWGFDFAAYGSQLSGMVSTIHTIDSAKLGIMAEYIEVVTFQKISVPSI